MIAASIYQHGTALDHVLHAIRLATLRRLLRNGEAGPLERALRQWNKLGARN